MIEVRQTLDFVEWLATLRDRSARLIIGCRIARLELGLFGDSKSVGGGVSELRVDHGPCYRVYFTRRGTMIVVLLCGGDKGDQVRDIVRARSLAGELE